VVKIASMFSLVCILAAWPATGVAEKIPPPVPAAVGEQLSAGTPRNLIILFDDRDVEAEVATLRQRAGKDRDDDSIRAVRRNRYRAIKRSALDRFQLNELEELRDYDHLPMSFFRVRNRAALDRLLADPRVQAVYEDAPVYPHLTYSLPFIGQPAVTSAGMTGSGATVAVIDTGINYTLQAFGSCTAPGVPTGCRVAASVDVTGNNQTLNTDLKGHGTNVAGIVAGVAGAARIAAINVFAGGVSSTSWIVAGINWAIANRDVYTITALNMSLGDNLNYTSPCSNSFTNPYVTPINNLRAAGIMPVASTGNSAFTNGMSSPACTPGVVSVGAVYDLAWRSSPDPAVSISFTACTESGMAVADKVPCFSNSASFMTMLAPGAFVAAAGIQMAGTSQAAPHVSAAVALLRTIYPADTLNQIVSRLTSSGVSVTDSRNLITKPRLNLSAAIGAPFNNMFAQRTILTGDSGRTTSHNLNATKESGEPAHAGNSGGKSVWWSWTPSVSGIAVIDTHGSSFNTLLAVYSGNTLAALSQVAANDNDGGAGSTSGVSFTALAGKEYLIAVDGYNAASGGLILNRSLVQQADLVLGMTQSPLSPFEGDQVTYTLTVTNNGPSAASGVVLTDQLPAGTLFVSASPGCSHSGGSVTCDLAGLASGTAAAVQIIVTAPAAGELINSAAVTSIITDPQAANNSSSLSATVSQASAVPAVSFRGLGAAALCLAGVAGRWNRRRRNLIGSNC
jgi:uncharacterized repeat protein (TIGR01451 family)